jgi:hypothetical protein
MKFFLQTFSFSCLLTSFITYVFGGINTVEFSQITFGILVSMVIASTIEEKSKTK